MLDREFWAAHECGAPANLLQSQSSAALGREAPLCSPSEKMGSSLKVNRVQMMWQASSQQNRSSFEKRTRAEGCLPRSELCCHGERLGNPHTAFPSSCFSALYLVSLACNSFLKPMKSVNLMYLVSNNRIHKDRMFHV